jgi:hypothetical protein
LYALLNLNAYSIPKSWRQPFNGRMGEPEDRLGGDRLGGLDPRSINHPEEISGRARVLARADLPSAAGYGEGREPADQQERRANDDTRRGTTQGMPLNPGTRRCRNRTDNGPCARRTQQDDVGTGTNGTR